MLKSLQCLCSMFSFGYFPGVWGLKADVSEPSIGSIFLGRWRKNFLNLRRRGNTQKKTYYIKPTVLMFLIMFARHSTQLISELSFYTAWDETVHMAACHGVSVVRLPPTKLRASAPQSSLVQLVFETSPAERNSFLFQHSSTPFTSQNSVFDFMTASRRKSSWVMPSSRNTKVVLALDAFVNGAARRSLFL